MVASVCRMPMMGCFDVFNTECINYKFTGSLNLGTFNTHKVFFSTLWLRQNGCHFADSIFECIFLNEILDISIHQNLGPINSTAALVQVMAWHQIGDMALFILMMALFNDIWMLHSAQTRKIFSLLWLRQNGCHFADSIFECIFLNEILDIQFTKIWVQLTVQQH